MRILSKRQIILLHSQLIEMTGGSDGIRDEGLLDSALAAPFQSYAGEELYTIILAIAAGEKDYSELLEWVIMHQQ